MEMIYNDLEMKFSIPEGWNLLSEAEANGLGIKSQPEVELIDVFTRTKNGENNIISFQDYGEVADFIDEFNSYVDDLKAEIASYKKNGADWKTKYPVNPISNSFKLINDKQTCAVVYETANVDTLVLQIYFMFKKKTYCLSCNINNSAEHISKLLENGVALECFELITSVDNAKQA